LLVNVRYCTPGALTAAVVQTTAGEGGCSAGTSAGGDKPPPPHAVSVQEAAPDNTAAATSNERFRAEKGRGKHEGRDMQVATSGFEGRRARQRAPDRR
jgi:hypothetical protein